MILAMRPDFVATHWNEIKETISPALPPTGITDGMSLNHVLETILSGNATCWVILGDDKIIQGFLITLVSIDYCTKTKSLHLYALAGNFTGTVYEDAWAVLINYARSIGCQRISGMTADPMMVSRAKMFNWDTSWRYMFKEV